LKKKANTKKKVMGFTFIHAKKKEKKTPQQAESVKKIRLTKLCNVSDDATVAAAAASSVSDMI
jgi:hypothetical protein